MRKGNGVKLTQVELQFIRAHPDLTDSQIGERLGRARTTVSAARLRVEREREQMVTAAKRRQPNCWSLAYDLECAVGHMALEAGKPVHLLMGESGGETTVMLTTRAAYAEKAPADVVGCWTRVEPGDVIDALRAHKRGDA